MSRGFGSTYGAGTTDSVKASFALGGNTKRSYSIWFYENGNGGGGFGRIFSKDNGSGTSETAFFDGGGTGNTLVIAYIRVNASGVLTGAHCNAANIVVARTWTHLVITHDGTTGTSTFPTYYWNGASTGLGTFNFTGTKLNSDNTNPFIVGNGLNGTRNWDGMLAHFAVWDGVLLSAQEAKALYMGAPPLKIRPGYLKSYVPMLGAASGPIDFRNAGGTRTGTLPGTTTPRVQLL